MPAIRVAECWPIEQQPMKRNVVRMVIWVATVQVVGLMGISTENGAVYFKIYLVAALRCRQRVKEQWQFARAAGSYAKRQRSIA